MLRRNSACLSSIFHSEPSYSLFCTGGVEGSAAANFPDSLAVSPHIDRMAAARWRELSSNWLRSVRAQSEGFLAPSHVTNAILDTLQEPATALDTPPDVYVIGCDEVGRGPLAGPVVCAAHARLFTGPQPHAYEQIPIRDTKKMSSRVRDESFRLLAHGSPLEVFASPWDGIPPVPLQQYHWVDSRLSEGLNTMLDPGILIAQEPLIHVVAGTSNEKILSPTFDLKSKISQLQMRRKKLSQSIKRLQKANDRHIKKKAPGPLPHDIEGVLSADAAEERDMCAQWVPRPTGAAYQHVFAVAIVNHAMIDKVNIAAASMLGMAASIRSVAKAIQSMGGVRHPVILVDGSAVPADTVREFPDGYCVPLPKGDDLSFSVAAAATLSKSVRVRLMGHYHAQYPQYGFDHHEGYPTKEHLSALELCGSSPIHRSSFKPRRFSSLI